MTKLLYVQWLKIIASYSAMLTSVVNLDLDSGGRREQYLYYVARESLSK